MAYPESYTTKKIKQEKKMMKIIDDHITSESEDPQKCWLSIREELMKEGLLEDKDNEILAKSYFADKMISPVVHESTINN